MNTFATKFEFRNRIATINTTERTKNDKSKMTGNIMSPKLLAVSENTVTTWDSVQDDKPSTFHPLGDLPIADATWNHNGQGTPDESVI